MRRAFSRMVLGGVLGGVLLCAAPLFAREQGVSPQVAEVVEAHLKARGASRVEQVLRAFLFEGDARVYALTAQKDGCLGFLALGLGDVRDVDLSLHTKAGQTLVEDTSVAPYAYVRVCVQRGVPLYVSAHLYAGRGELTLFAVEDAPREIGRLPHELALAARPGGAIEGLRNIGMAEESPFEGPMLNEERELSELGYTGFGPVTPIALRGGTGVGIAQLDAGRCYRVVTLVPFARGVALTMVGPSGRVWQVRRPASDRVPLFACTGDEGGEFRLRVESRVVRSIALVRAFELPNVNPDELRRLGEARAMGVAEARNVARTRGLAVEHVGEAWVEGATPLAWPLTFEAGHCYALWALGEAGLASVDVRLIDGAGVLVARTEGPPHGASLFHCATKAGGYRVVLRPRGPDGMVSLWLGRPTEEGP